MIKTVILFVSLPVITLAAKGPFSHRSQASIVTTGGNSRVETYNAQTSNTYKVGKRSYILNGHYTLGLAESDDDDSNDLVESARNWDAAFRYEQEIAPHLSLYSGIQYEGNTFAGFLQRENFDIGEKYTFVDTEKELLTLVYGYRYTEEHRTEVDEETGERVLHFNKGNFELTYRKKRKSFTLGFWVQYLPNFTREKDYQINAEPYFSMILSDIFSIKLAYKMLYDNEPNIDGNERIDWQYTTSLVAEF